MLTDTKPVHTDDQPRTQLVMVLTVGLLIVAAFQAALTLGAPLGAAAQGGTNPGQLPDALRLVAGVFTVVWVFAALLVLARGGRALVPLPQAVHRRGIWGLVMLLGVGALLNLASSSPWERFGWGPFTLVLFILTVVLARSELPAGPAPRAGAVLRSTSTGKMTIDPVFRAEMDSRETPLMQGRPRSRTPALHSTATGAL